MGTVLGGSCTQLSGYDLLYIAFSSRILVERMSYLANSTCRAFGVLTADGTMGKGRRAACLPSGQGRQVLQRVHWCHLPASAGCAMRPRWRRHTRYAPR